MDAAALVALASEIGREFFSPENRNAPDLSAYIGETLRVGSNGDWYIGHPAFLWVPVLSAPLTPENVRTEDALVRALLASAITVETRDGFFIAYVGDHFTDTHFSEAEARDALLDALLGEVTA